MCISILVLKIWIITFGMAFRMHILYVGKCFRCVSTMIPNVTQSVNVNHATVLYYLYNDTNIGTFTRCPIGRDFQFVCACNRIAQVCMAVIVLFICPVIWLWISRHAILNIMNHRSSDQIPMATGTEIQMRVEDRRDAINQSTLKESELTSPALVHIHPVQLRSTRIPIRDYKPAPTENENGGRVSALSSDPSTSSSFLVNTRVTLHAVWATTTLMACMTIKDKLVMNICGPSLLLVLIAMICQHLCFMFFTVCIYQYNVISMCKKSAKNWAVKVCQLCF
jgi:hypothetical protein